MPARRFRHMNRRRKSVSAGGALALIVATVLVVVVIVSGGGGGDGSGTGTGTGQLGPSVSASPAAPTSSSGAATPRSGLKPELTGLLDRAGPAPATSGGYVRGFVINANWSDLQPAAGGPIAANNVIDQELGTVRQMNSTISGAPLSVKLRIYAGTQAPDWLKAQDGGPISVTDPQSQTAGTIGHFWSANFAAAYTLLMQELAARYDSAPELRDVTITRCTTVFAEPMIRQSSDRATVSALLAAGYSSSADAACQTDEIDEAGAAWKHTHLSLALNPYQQINADGSARVDQAFTNHVMQYCRQQLGEQCVLENNSLRSPAQPAYAVLYAEMRIMGPPLSFQTATGARVGDLEQTVRLAQTMGALNVELPAGYRTLMTAAVAAQLTSALASQPQR